MIKNLFVVEGPDGWLSDSGENDYTVWQTREEAETAMHDEISNSDGDATDYSVIEFKRVEK